MFDTLDQLIGPLTLRIMELLGQPVTGTDDQMQHIETKRGFFGLLNAILAAKLQAVFLSPRNKPQLEPLLSAVQRFTLDTSDPAAQRAALLFLGRCATVWAAIDPAGVAPTDEGAMAGGALPGFEQFVYNSIVPGVFELIKLPEVNPKDGQMMLVGATISELNSVALTRIHTGYSGSRELVADYRACTRARGVQFLRERLPSSTGLASG